MPVDPEQIVEAAVTVDKKQKKEAVEAKKKASEPKKSGTSSKTNPLARPEKQGKHYTPSQFNDHPWAKEANGFIDELDPLYPDRQPATRFKLGQAYVATAAEFTNKSPEIHPAWLAVGATFLVAAMLLFHWWQLNQGIVDAGDPDERKHFKPREHEPDSESQHTPPVPGKEGNRFAELL